MIFIENISLTSDFNRELRYNKNKKNIDNEFGHLLF